MSDGQRNSTRRRSLLAAATAICAFLIAAPGHARQPQVSAEDVKATFLFNFAKFVDWPARVFARSNPTFTICLAEDPFDGALDRLVQGEVLDGRRLVVRRIKNREELPGCQIVYLGNDDRRGAELIRAAVDQPILTVGETSNAINDGAILRFVMNGGKITFEINPDAAERASLKVSSRLLRVAVVRSGVPSGGRQ